MYALKGYGNSNYTRQIITEETRNKKVMYVVEVSRVSNIVSWSKTLKQDKLEISHMLGAIRLHLNEVINV